MIAVFQGIFLAGKPLQDMLQRVVRFDGAWIGTALPAGCFAPS